MAFTAVGTQVSAAATTGQGTISITTTTLGDLVVMHTTLGSLTNFITGITGGGCGTWTQIGTPTAVSGLTATLQAFYGTVTTVGTASTAATFNSSVGATNLTYQYQPFSAGLGATTSWTVAASGVLINTASTTVTYPTLTPPSGTDLYVGYCQAIGTTTVGSTSGYTYEKTTSPNNSQCLAYNLAVTAASHPTCTQSSSSASTVVATLYAAALATNRPRLRMINQAVNRASSF